MGPRRTDPHHGYDSLTNIVLLANPKARLQSLRPDARSLRFLGIALADSRMHGLASNPYVPRYGLAGSAYHAL